MYNIQLVKHIVRSLHILNKYTRKYQGDRKKINKKKNYILTEIYHIIKMMVNFKRLPVVSLSAQDLGMQTRWDRTPVCLGGASLCHTAFTSPGGNSVALCSTVFQQSANILRPTMTDSQPRPGE